MQLVLYNTEDEENFGIGDCAIFRESQIDDRNIYCTKVPKKKGPKTFFH